VWVMAAAQEAAALRKGKCRIEAGVASPNGLRVAIIICGPAGSTPLSQRYPTLDLVGGGLVDESRLARVNAGSKPVSRHRTGYVSPWRLRSARY
jgi:hypothetical protein